MVQPPIHHPMPTQPRPSVSHLYDSWKLPGSTILEGTGRRVPLALLQKLFACGPCLQPGGAQGLVLECSCTPGTSLGAVFLCQCLFISWLSPITKLKPFCGYGRAAMEGDSRKQCRTCRDYVASKNFLSINKTETETWTYSAVSRRD